MTEAKEPAIAADAPPATESPERVTRPPAIDLRAAAALLVLATLLALAGVRWPLVGWLVLLLVGVGILRSLGFVLVARQSGLDPEAHLTPTPAPPAAATKEVEPPSPA